MDRLVRLLAIDVEDGNIEVAGKDDSASPVKARRPYLKGPKFIQPAGDLNPGDAIDVPRGAAHRIANRGEDDLIFVEVQHGDYFGEDDIERLYDDFGRAR
jgi:hypothetical protein